MRGGPNGDIESGTQAADLAWPRPEDAPRSRAGLTRARSGPFALSLLCALLRSEGKQNSRIPRTSFPFKMEIELKEVTRVTKFDYFLFS